MNGRRGKGCCCAEGKSKSKEAIVCLKSYVGSPEERWYVNIRALWDVNAVSTGK